jgi:hypothetical protein
MTLQAPVEFDRWNIKCGEDLPQGTVPIPLLVYVLYRSGLDPFTFSAPSSPCGEKLATRCQEKPSYDDARDGKA